MACLLKHFCLKEKISDYRNWDQLEHAHDYLLYPENIGETLSFDETCLSNGDVYTILTNKAAKGRKGALVAMVRGVATDAVSGILRRFRTGNGCLSRLSLQIYLQP